MLQIHSSISITDDLANTSIFENADVSNFHYGALSADADDTTHCFVCAGVTYSGVVFTMDGANIMKEVD